MIPRREALRASDQLTVRSRRCIEISDFSISGFSLGSLFSVLILNRLFAQRLPRADDIKQVESLAKQVGRVNSAKTLQQPPASTQSPIRQHLLRAIRLHGLLAISEYWVRSRYSLGSGTHLARCVVDKANPAYADWRWTTYGQQVRSTVSRSAYPPKSATQFAH